MHNNVWFYQIIETQTNNGAATMTLKISKNYSSSNPGENYIEATKANMDNMDDREKFVILNMLGLSELGAGGYDGILFEGGKDLIKIENVGSAFDMNEHEDSPLGNLWLSKGKFFAVDADAEQQLKGVRYAIAAMVEAGSVIADGRLQYVIKVAVSSHVDGAPESTFYFKTSSRVQKINLRHAAIKAINKWLNSEELEDWAAENITNPSPESKKPEEKVCELCIEMAATSDSELCDWCEVYRDNMQGWDQHERQNGGSQ